MMGILPLVFNGVIHFCKSAFANAEIWMVIVFEFNTALVVFAAAALILVVGSLILLAAQHG
jgi:hypothetical protein